MTGTIITAVILLLARYGYFDCHAHTGYSQSVHDEIRFELHSDSIDYNLVIIINERRKMVPIPRIWLIPSVDDEAGYVSSFHYDNEVNSFEIGNGNFGIHLSSYEIQREGSAQAAAGRDVFIVYDVKNHAVFPGIVDLGITKERVRSMGLYARNTRFLLADIDKDGLKDLGIIKEEFRCAQFRDTMNSVVNPRYRRYPIYWYVFKEKKWIHDRKYSGKSPGKIDRRLPLIGLVKSPVDFVREMCIKNNIHIMDYSDFGPQSMAYELIGFQWYQWDKAGDPDPRKKYEIKVIVYRNISLTEVKKVYPVIKSKNQDYRYVEYNQGLVYIEKQLKEIENFRREDSDQEFTDLYNSLNSTLNNTKRDILERLR
jgi:hypothetical protein